MSNIGEQIESWTLYGAPDQLTSEQRTQAVEFAAGFEECIHSRDELAALNDAELIKAAYWAMADYARGQL